MIFYCWHIEYLMHHPQHLKTLFLPKQRSSVDVVVCTPITMMIHNDIRMVTLLPMARRCPSQQQTTTIMHYRQQIPTTQHNCCIQHPRINNARIIITPTTQIILTPPKIVLWRDLLHNYYNPITQKVTLGVGTTMIRFYNDDDEDDDDGDANINDSDYEHANISRKHQPQLQPQHLPVNCELCHDRRNSIAEINLEPIQLCERKGCNA